MDINAFLKKQSALIEDQLDQLVVEKNVPYKELFRAARYSLLNGGKRLRPILAIATAQTFGIPLELALRPACCLEMIHTYSMIHDDLPCMDNDDFRRGKPSLHKVFPEGHAVLTGDFLLTYPFEILATDPLLSPIQKIHLIRILAQRAGGDGMIGGQVLDLESEGKLISLETLRLIHHSKTGAMISASIEFGGVLANASAEQMVLLREFGRDIGLAFQIIDDILDVTASTLKHGKMIGSDIANQKTTYATLLGVETSQNLADHLFDTAISTLNQLSLNTTLLQSIAESLVHRSQ